MLEQLKRLGQRKMAQWALAYAAAAWVALQVLGLAAGSYNWSPTVMRVAFGIAVLGFVITLVLAWFHGERGQQKVTGSELLLLAGVLAVGGSLIWNSERQQATTVAAATAPSIAVATPATSTTVDDAQSIAVLPFVNLSSDPEQEYFSDGLSEDLITALSQFNGLKVISRNSSFQFRGAEQDSRSIGSKLGVAHLLAGSVRRAGDVVRITTDLVSVADGRTLWSQRYDRPYTDLFRLQDEITQAVATELKAKLLIDEGAVVQSDRPPSGSLPAYNAYLQGRFQAASSSPEGFKSSFRFFGEAIRLDPGYAQAHAALGAALALNAGIFLSGAEARADVERGRKYLDAALRLAPDLAFAHYGRAQLLLVGDLDWVGAQEEFQTVRKLAPNDSAGLYGLAQSEAVFGHAPEAIGLMRQAIELDPLDVGRLYWLSIWESGVGNLDEAERLADRVVEMAPDANQGGAQKVFVQALRGQHGQAMTTANSLKQGLWRDVALALATQRAGDAVAADAALRHLIDTQSEGAGYQIAQVYAWRKQPDEMFAWLDRAWTHGDPGIRRTLLDPFLKPYRADPRFAAFCKKVGLPEPK